MLDAQEAADFLKISYYTILEKAKKGLIPCTRIGARVLFSQEGLEAWIEDQESQSINKPDTDQQYGKLRKILG
jgi:excisionase family DNA binding protein